MTSTIVSGDHGTESVGINLLLLVVLGGRTTELWCFPLGGKRTGTAGSLAEPADGLSHIT